MASSQKRIGTWPQLAAMLEEYREKGWLFRGEPSPHYDSLVPKVGRFNPEEGSGRKVAYSRADEIRAFEDFKKAARPYLSREPRSDIEWMALGQHHGLPTRLLDWTDSLFIAAFFAVERTGRLGDAESGGAVIWCVKDIPEIDEQTEGTEGLFSMKEVKYFRPPHITPRMTVQRSIVTVHPDPTHPFEHPSLQRWLIERSACWDIKRSLNAAGISYSSLFPDLDGVGRQIGWLYKWAYFTGDSPKR